MFDDEERDPRPDPKAGGLDNDDADILDIAIVEPGVSLQDDFWAYMPAHKYIYGRLGTLWPAESINGRFGKVTVGIGSDGKPIEIPAAKWLDRNRACEQWTWSPGEARIITDRLMEEESWIAAPGTRCFNLYQPPLHRPGDPNNAGRWLNLLARVYPEEWEHLVRCFAHRVQHPGEKINHAPVLGGIDGIGKDSILAAFRYAVGARNWKEATPTQVMGEFNPFIKGVVLRISEIKDLSDSDKYKFYEHMKILIAAPPEVLMCNEKHRDPYPVPNVVFIVMTTNNRDALYLSKHDRRYYVAWSNAAAMTEDERKELWNWYYSGGFDDVTAYLRTVDLSGFDPKAPPPRTRAHDNIVAAGQSEEYDEFADALDHCARYSAARADGAGRIDPDQLVERWPAITVEDLKTYGGIEDAFRTRLDDPKYRKQIPHRLAECGYVRIGNPDARDGRWKIRGKRQTIYVLEHLSLEEQLRAARELQSRRGRLVSGDGID